VQLRSLTRVPVSKTLRRVHCPYCAIRRWLAVCLPVESPFPLAADRCRSRELTGNPWWGLKYRNRPALNVKVKDMLLVPIPKPLVAGGSPEDTVRTQSKHTNIYYRPRQGISADQWAGQRIGRARQGVTDSK
jgi:hypothetical protein